MPRDLDATATRPGSRSILVRAALIASCAVGLAGCYAQPAQDISAFAPTDVRMRHPIVIKEQDHTVELFIGNSRSGLTADQRADVLAFASAWRREASGGVIIEIPAGTPNAAAARGASREAKSILHAAGVPADGIVVRSHKVADPARLATVRLSYPRMAAEAGPCGTWPADLGPTAAAYWENKSYWNFGCASQRNLAAVVANPADLVQPRGEGPAYQMRRTTVMETYRTGAKTGGAGTTIQISEVGK
jgi:pilus assembly protein CpaD